MTYPVPEFTSTRFPGYDKVVSLYHAARARADASHLYSVWQLPEPRVVHVSDPRQAWIAYFEAIRCAIRSEEVHRAYTLFRTREDASP